MHVVRYCSNSSSRHRHRKKERRPETGARSEPTAADSELALSGAERRASGIGGRQWPSSAPPDDPSVSATATENVSPTGGVTDDDVSSNDVISLTSDEVRTPAVDAAISCDGPPVRRRPRPPPVNSADCTTESPASRAVGPARVLTSLPVCWRG